MSVCVIHYGHLFNPRSIYVDSYIIILVVCAVDRVDEVDEDGDQHDRITPPRLTSTRIRDRMKVYDDLY